MVCFSGDSHIHRACSVVMQLRVHTAAAAAAAAAAMCKVIEENSGQLLLLLTVRSRVFE